MKKHVLLMICIVVLSSCRPSGKDKGKENQRQEGYEDLTTEFENAVNVILTKWYPLVIDKEDGGFYSEVTYDFKLGDNQNKMVVTQARHVWTTAKATKFSPKESSTYLAYAEHGFKFFRDVLWDKENGGFHNLVNRKGNPIVKDGEAKTAYGNAFAIYGLAAYYKASNNEEALNLARKAFNWLEEHSHDVEFGGYFQHMEMDGTPLKRNREIPSTSDIGYKDQNSSIHLLEAFTELYKVWPDELVGKRLKELLTIIRDTIVNDNDYMNLFFEQDWAPISFKRESKDEIKKHYYLDHVSFGHDIETAYLLLEASKALGLKKDTLTLARAKKMVDQCLNTGFDNEIGGIYDGGYYYEGQDEISVTDDRKNWWSQAEGLNTLSFMASKFPEDSIYENNFNGLWNYIDTYIIDHENGGWYEWGVDKSPESKIELKGHIWKATYHNYRALTNILKRMDEREREIAI